MIYLLKRIGKTPYDEFAGFVVRASTPEGARSLVVDRLSAGPTEGNLDDLIDSPWGWYGEAMDWLDPGLTSCEKLSGQGDPVIAMADYRAG